MTNAPQPTRRSGSGTLSFGLISIPVDFYTAEDSKAVGKVSRSLRAIATGNPIKYKNVDGVTGEEVARGEQYKVVVTDDGEVSLDDAEIEAILSPVKGHAEILTFIPESKAREMYATKHFQVRPHNPGTNKTTDPGVAKAWALLSGAMIERSSAALIRLFMRDTLGHYVLFSDGRMASVLPPCAVREQRPMPEASTSQAEQELALALLDASFSEEVPELVDDGVERIMAYVGDKLAGKTTKPTTVPLETRSTDLIDQLMKSIQVEQDKKAEV